jgi:hypothetical protein
LTLSIIKSQPAAHHLTSIKHQAPKASVSQSLFGPQYHLPGSFYFELDVAPNIRASIPPKVRHQPFSLALHITNSKNSSTWDRKAVCL